MPQLVDKELAYELQDLKYDGCAEMYMNEETDESFVLNYDSDHTIPIPRIDDVIHWLRKTYRLKLDVVTWWTSSKQWKEWHNPSEFDFQWEVNEYHQENEDLVDKDKFVLIDNGIVNRESFDRGYELAQLEAVRSAVKYLKTKLL